MAIVNIEFVDDHGNRIEITERSTVPLAATGVQAAQLAQEAFRKFLLVCGLGVQPAAAEPDAPAARADEPAETRPASEKATPKARATDG